MASAIIAREKEKRYDDVYKDEGDNDDDDEDGDGDVGSTGEGRIQSSGGVGTHTVRQGLKRISANFGESRKDFPSHSAEKIEKKDSPTKILGCHFLISCQDCKGSNSDGMERETERP